MDDQLGSVVFHFDAILATLATLLRFVSFHLQTYSINTGRKTEKRRVKC